MRSRSSQSRIRQVPFVAATPPPPPPSSGGCNNACTNQEVCDAGTCVGAPRCVSSCTDSGRRALAKDLITSISLSSVDNIHVRMQRVAVCEIHRALLMVSRPALSNTTTLLDALAPMAMSSVCHVASAAAPPVIVRSHSTCLPACRSSLWQ